MSNGIVNYYSSGLYKEEVLSDNPQKQNIQKKDSMDDV